MIKNKKIQPNLGDLIITTSKFVYGENIKGTVVIKPQQDGSTLVSDIFGIKFDKKTNWTHDLDGNLPQPTGHFLLRENFNIQPYINKDKYKQSFVKNMCDRQIQKIMNIPKKIKELNNDVKYYTSEAKRSEKSVLVYRQKVKESHQMISNLKLKDNIPFKAVQENLENQFDRLLKYKKIKKVQIIKDYIIITTNNLIYKKTATIPHDFNLGAYLIFIPTKVSIVYPPNDSSIEIKAVNYKRHFNKRYFHPCVAERGRICLGQVMRDEIYKHLEKQQLDSLMISLISFLEKPNYTQPFIDDINFMCAQPVTLKPKNLLKFLDPVYWDDHQKWNSHKYDDDIKKVKKELSNQRKRKTGSGSHSTDGSIGISRSSNPSYASAIIPETEEELSTFTGSISDAMETDTGTEELNTNNGISTSTSTSAY